VVEVDLPTRTSAMDWIYRCQLGRRNLSRAQASLYQGLRFNLLKLGRGGDRRSKPRLEAMKTAERLAREIGVSRATIERNGQFVEALEALREIDPTLKRRILAGLESPSRQTVIEAARLAGDDPEASWRRLQGTMTSTSSEWHTPRHVIAAVLKVLGAIDLDPCSPITGPATPAKRHFTPLEDGLAQEWTGRVFMNPPYGRETPVWTDKLLSEWQCGRTTAAIALLASRTETAWMGRLREMPRCFLRGRLSFSDSSQSAPFSSVAVYFGEDVRGFQSVFSALGDVYVLLK